MGVVIMSNKLLTDVIIQLVNEEGKNDQYGVSITNLPVFDYATFVNQVKSNKKIEFYFLGFSHQDEESIRIILPTISDKTYYFTVEEAEASRNSGDENIFRVLILKRPEIEKLSSLRWFDNIDLEMIYKKSCHYVSKNLSISNTVIESLISALGRQDIRAILNFERVLEYFEVLLSASPENLPMVLKDNYYRLGLCKDSTLDMGMPSCDYFRMKIKQNRSIVTRIGGLEQAERQSINNFYGKNPTSTITKLILKYYKTKDINLLGEMELEEVEKCLKNVTQKTSNKVIEKKKSIIKPTALAAELIFDNEPEQINTILEQIEQNVDNRNDIEKPARVEIEAQGTKLLVKTEPTTERLSKELITKSDFGGVIYADVENPKDAIDSIDKYEFIPFDEAYLQKTRDYLQKANEFINEQGILNCLNKFIDNRKNIEEFKMRLQDAPMLQVIKENDKFSAYLNSYAKLLSSINEDFPKLWKIAPSVAKDIINTIISLDVIYVISENECHAMPTPLNPLYLWKYIKLAEEILDAKGVTESEACHLTNDDKAFIIRKAEDIPDPLSVMLLPAIVREQGSIFLPLSGRIGNVPVYSTKQQINQGESGIEALKQAIIRYLCLYPHASMMLRMSFVNPPSVEVLVSMLKMLNNDKEFQISGIDISIYRTKEATSNWVEIEDNSLNEGMLGNVKGKKDLQFNLSIINKTLSYQQILQTIDKEQHLIVIFDPNEIKVDIAQNNRQIHIHPLCVPKIYDYDPFNEKINIRATNEGGIFSDYASIIEKLNEHPSSFSHTSTFFNTPLKEETYKELLNNTDWLVILDQNLKSWDISLRSASEKIFYKDDDYRSMGIYSNNNNKFVLGYETLISTLGNFIPKQQGIKTIIQTIRDVNDDGLLSIVSHTSNSIFDNNHGKGSLGLAIASIDYNNTYSDAIMVGLDTQLAREWLSDREDGKLPDLIGIRLIDNESAIIDIIEVKTYDDYQIDNDKISGHAVEQVSVLEKLIKEIFGASEKITTVSRREILREQVFECLFHTYMDSSKKHRISQMLNNLFAGEYIISVSKTICHVSFDQPISSKKIYFGKDNFHGEEYKLNIIGSDEIQAIISNTEYTGVNLTLKRDCQVNTTSTAGVNEQEEQVNEIVEVPQHKNNIELDNLSNTDNGSENDVYDNDVSDNARIIHEKCIRLNKVFKDFGIKVQPVKEELIQHAARFTRFKLELYSGETIKNLEKYKSDIGRELEAYGEILIDNIKGTRFVGMDVPFENSCKPLKLIDYISLLSNSNGALDILAGQTPDGKIEIADIAQAPHILIGGTTGSGKTVFLYSMIVSLVEQYNSEQLELLIIDPKQTDFAFFNSLPHLRGGSVITDTEEALNAINTINSVDKEERTKLLKDTLSRDIDSYNQKYPNKKMKRLVVIIDEYADLIQTAEILGIRKDFESRLCMLAQRVRNLGIHLVIATQRPNAAIVTSSLKANIPFRISFRLPAHQDSITILDRSGAEDLLGKGDMLMVTESDVKRMQGFYISESELIEFLNNKIEKDNKKA